MAKLTFSLDAATVERLRTTAERLGMPQSQVVREAVAEYAANVGRLSESERDRLLKVVDELVARMPTRSPRATAAEIRHLRSARRRGGRRSAAR